MSEFNLKSNFIPVKSQANTEKGNALIKNNNIHQILSESKMDPYEFYQNNLDKLISTDDGSDISKKMIEKTKSQLEKVKHNSSTVAYGELPSQPKNYEPERVPFLKFPGEDGTIIEATAPSENNISKLEVSDKINKNSDITIQQSKIEPSLNKILKSNIMHHISTNNLLRNSRDPRINIENVKQIIMQKIFFKNMEKLRIYNYSQGYYQIISTDGVLIEINRYIPLSIRDNIEPSDLRKLFDAIRLDPNIQLKPEFLQDNNKFLINCNNGVLNFNNIFSSKKPYLLEHSNSYCFINCVQANYINNYNINNTHFEKFLITSTGGDSELIILLQEVLGYAFSNLNNAKKGFLLYGVPDSGKSLLLKVITSICGEENVSNIPLQNLSEDKYVAELYGKLINIFSELPDKSIDDTGTFKALVSETDKVIAKKLYEDPFSFYNKCKLFFATNNLPEIKTTSYKDNLAFFNRLIIIPFRYGVPENQQDKELGHKLINEKDLIFSWAVDGLIRYITNGCRFSHCSISSTILNSYKLNSNNILSFLNERCLIDRDSYVHMDRLFLAFANYCNDNILDVPTNKDKRQLKNILNEKYNIQYKRINRPDGNKYGFIGLKLIEN